MIAVDTNILVYAHREGFPEHGRARLWLEALARGSAPWCLPVFVVSEFLRVVTHRRVLSPPSTIDQAFAAIASLLESPTLRLIGPGEDFPSLLEEAVRHADARGNLVFDAQLAAVCREHGVTRFLTEDRDFSRFPWLATLKLADEVLVS